MRETLYFKDDDARLSFLTGNYITFTNMKEDELARIIDYKFSPINISVHTTDPELRIKMLNNKNAGKALSYITRLHNAGIELNFQIVLVKGVNDGENLRKTISDLSAYLPVAKSLSVVPVGITKYRKGLFPVDPFNREDATEILDLVAEFQKELKEKYDNSFVFCSDEFYILADRPMSDVGFYEDFPQIENGVGMLSLFLDEIGFALEGRKPKPGNSKISLVTGMAAKPFLERASKEIMSCHGGLTLDICPVKNDFFGEKITVSGLLTGRDIIAQLKGKELGKAVFLPQNLLRSGETVLLDDITIDDLSEALGVKVMPVRTDGEALVSSIWRLT